MKGSKPGLTRSAQPGACILRTETASRTSAWDQLCCLITLYGSAHTLKHSVLVSRDGRGPLVVFSLNFGPACSRVT